MRSVKVCALAATLMLTACAAPVQHSPDPEPPQDLRSSVEALVDELVTLAERRVALGTLRVVVDEIPPQVPVPEQRARLAGREVETASLSGALEDELETALSRRLYVYEERPVPAGESIAERGARLGATHAVVGTWKRERSTIEVSLRLIDLETQLIIAPARARLSFVPVYADLRTLHMQDGPVPRGVTGTAVEVPEPDHEPSQPVLAAPLAAGLAGSAQPSGPIAYETSQAAPAFDPDDPDAPVPGPAFLRLAKLRENQPPPTAPEQAPR